MTEEKEYDLATSKEKFGCLVPILRDANDNVIDGFHRLEIDQNWPSIKLEHIKDKLQLTLARLAVNIHRRNVPGKEKEMLLTEIAELTGWKPKEIADALGMSLNWVYKYLPDKYKDKEMREVGRRSAEASLVTRRVTTELVECDNCHEGVHTSEAHKIGHRVLCTRCFDKLPEVSKRIAKKLASTIPLKIKEYPNVNKTEEEQPTQSQSITCPKCGHQWEA